MRKTVLPKTPPHKLAYIKKCGLQNRDKVLEYKRRWNEKNKERLRPIIAERARLRRRALGDIYRAQQREWYWKSVDKRRAQMRRYQKRSKYKQKWKAKNPEKWAEINRRHVRKWQARNPEKNKVLQRRTKLQRRAFGTVSSADFRFVFDHHAHRCVYCASTERLEIDHRVPVSRGGTNSLENLQIACRSCNGQKWSRTHEEFLQVLAKRCSAQDRCSSRLFAVLPPQNV